MDADTNQNVNVNQSFELPVEEFDKVGDHNSGRVSITGGMKTWPHMVIGKTFSPTGSALRIRRPVPQTYKTREICRPVPLKFADRCVYIPNL